MAYDGNSNGSESCCDIGISESGAFGLRLAPGFVGDELGNARGDELPAVQITVNLHTSR